MMDKKHTIILIFISLTTLIVMLLGATYAYLASSVDNEDSTPIGATMPSPVVAFVTSGSGEINLDVAFNKMLQAVSNETSAPEELTDRAQLSVYFSAAEDQKLNTCSYNIIYEWNENSSDYIRTPNVAKEFTISSKVLSINNAPTLSADDPNYHLFKIENSNLPETNFDELNWQTKTITVGAGDDAITKQVRYANLIEGAKISSLDKDIFTIVNYEFEVKFYNANHDQSEQKGKNFAGSIKVDSDSISC